MNYFAHYQQQEYDPSSQNQQLYDHPTNNYYYYSYSYSNPQYTTIHPYSYPNLTVQPSQHEEQEPNPPGVTPPPPQELGLRSIYPLTLGPQQGAVDTAVAGVYPSNVQSYSSIGIINGIAPGGDAQTHLLSKPNVSHQSYHAHGRGMASALQMNAAVAPSQNQAVIVHGGLNIRGGPPQLLSRSYAESYLSVGQNTSGRPYRGRGRGRGKGRALQNRAATPSQDQKIFDQRGSDIQGGPSQPMPQSVASGPGQIPVPLQGLAQSGSSQPMPQSVATNLGQIPVLLQGPAQSVPVLPPSKAVCCELCRVECNTVEILKQHMNGKKHKKKLKVFEEMHNLNKRVIRRQTKQSSTSELKPEVPSQPDQIEGSGNQQHQQEILPSQEINEETQVAVEEQKLVAIETAEESVKKVMVDRSGGVGRGLKRKMRGGKGSRRTKPCDRSKKVVEPPKSKEFIPLVCELCNVKCESSVVFQSHLVGKKHQSKAKRFLGHPDTLGQEPLQPQAPAVQAVDQQNANASTSNVSQVQDQGFSAPQVASAQSIKIIDVQASTLEAVNLPKLLGTNPGASNLVNAQDI